MVQKVFFCTAVMKQKSGNVYSKGNRLYLASMFFYFPYPLGLDIYCRYRSSQSRYRNRTAQVKNYFSFISLNIATPYRKKFKCKLQMLMRSVSYVSVYKSFSFCHELFLWESVWYSYETKLNSSNNF